jgi:putative FmdB family regulatory protein
MPIYDFECRQCGAFDAIRKVSERDSAVACPSCRAPASRVANDLLGLRTPRRASLARMPSRESDASEGGYGMRHAGLCACCA